MFWDWKRCCAVQSRDCLMLPFVVKLPESKSHAMLAGLAILVRGAKPLLGSAYLVHGVVMAGLGMDRGHR
jgi:hypothetical protein